MEQEIARRNEAATRLFGKIVRNHFPRPTEPIKPPQPSLMPEIYFFLTLILMMIFIIVSSIVYVVAKRRAHRLNAIDRKKHSYKVNQRFDANRACPAVYATQVTRASVATQTTLVTAHEIATQTAQELRVSEDWSENFFDIILPFDNTEETETSRVLALAYGTSSAPPEPEQNTEPEPEPEREYNDRQYRFQQNIINQFQYHITQYNFHIHKRHKQPRDQQQGQQQQGPQQQQQQQSQDQQQQRQQQLVKTTVIIEHSSPAASVIEDHTDILFVNEIVEDIIDAALENNVVESEIETATPQPATDGTTLVTKRVEEAEDAQGMCTYYDYFIIEPKLTYFFPPVTLKPVPAPTTAAETSVLKKKDISSTSVLENDVVDAAPQPTEDTWTEVKSRKKRNRSKKKSLIQGMNASLIYAFILIEPKN